MTVYVPATGNVKVSWKPLCPDTKVVATTVPLGWRTVTSTPGIVFPLTVSVTRWPAVAVNERTAVAPAVSIVTVVAVPIAVEPVLSGMP